MRFLFTVQPTTGHFHSMVPLALALQEHGHEVAFATGSSFGPVVQRSSFLHFPCGFDFDGSGDICAALPEWKSVQARHPGPVAVQQMYSFVEGLAPRMVKDLVPIIGAWKPDLIIRDPLEFGGYIAAELAGLPHATLSWAIYIPAQLICPEALDALRQQSGLPQDPGLKTIDRFLVLNFLPPAWTFPGSPAERVTHRFCAPPFDRTTGEGLPGWVDTLPEGSTVHVTLGTTFNRSPGLFRAILEALSTEMINVIVTVGRSLEPAQFQPPASRIRVVQYIPQSLLHPRCDALVFHGGYNSLRSALWHGLPMVILPQGGGDQAPNAQRCAELGVGIVVEGDPPEAGAIRRAVRTVLEDSSYRRRAVELQREMKALPGLSEAVKRLERLARDQEPQFRE